MGGAIAFVLQRIRHRLVMVIIVLPVRRNRVFQHVMKITVSVCRSEAIMIALILIWVMKRNVKSVQKTKERRYVAQLDFAPVFRTGQPVLATANNARSVLQRKEWLYVRSTMESVSVNQIMKQVPVMEQAVFLARKPRERQFVLGIRQWVVTMMSVFVRRLVIQLPVITTTVLPAIPRKMAKLNVVTNGRVVVLA